MISIFASGGSIGCAAIATQAPPRVYMDLQVYNNHAGVQYGVYPSAGGYGCKCGIV